MYLFHFLLPPPLPSRIFDINVFYRSPFSFSPFGFPPNPHQPHQHTPRKQNTHHLTKIEAAHQDNQRVTGLEQRVTSGATGDLQSKEVQVLGLWRGRGGGGTGALMPLIRPQSLLTHADTLSLPLLFHPRQPASPLPRPPSPQPSPSCPDLHLSPCSWSLSAAATGH